MLTRRNLIGLLVLDVALFLLANIFSKSTKHPGTLSNVCWVAFLLGVLLLVVLAVVAFVQARRVKTRTA